MKLPRPSWRHWAGFLPGTLAVLAGLAGATIFLLPVFHFNEDRAEVSYEPIITHSTLTPIESLDDARSYKWRGSASEPKKLRITSIAVDSFIQKSGIDHDGRVAVPTNIYLVSWLIDSARPGQAGLAIIAGHVGGRTRQGVFEYLTLLKKGDTFEIEMGNGRTFTYRVFSTVTVKGTESAEELLLQSPTAVSQVNLITLSGKYGAAAANSNTRTIVSGELIRATD